MLTLFFIYSNGNAQHEQHKIMEPAKDSMNSFQTNNMPMDFKTKFSVILSAYIQLKNALVKSDPNAASTAGKLVMKAIEGIDSKSLTNKQNLVWMIFADKIYYDAEHIKGTSEMEHQREHFMTLSKNLFEMAEALNANKEDLYYQFCPMANEGKGAYWISEQSKIKNPYYGKKMLTCGSTKGTLPAAKR